MNEKYRNDIKTSLELDFGVTPENASVKQLYSAVSKSAAAQARANAENTEKEKSASYLSAEFLVGRMIYSNLLNLGLLDETKELLSSAGRDISSFEEIEDNALGNGGLGRLAACFLDSAATHDIPLNGYGIRYRYGLFKQYIVEGFQKEAKDDWQSYGDPWSIRREEDAVRIDFAGSSVMAVPYDMPVIGYGGKTVNFLRLWQSEALEAFDFEAFSDESSQDAEFIRSRRLDAVRERLSAEQISDVLYPADGTDEGKKLRIMQEYFFAAASVRDMVRRYEKRWGSDFSLFSHHYAIQLNDTHPVVAVPELMRILIEEKNMSKESAFEVVVDTFAYTNHTVMAEALETWSTDLFFSLLPDIYRYIVIIDDMLACHLQRLGIKASERGKYRIICSGRIHMARLAIFSSHSTNGVAWLHTEILKNRVLKEWYELYPERFNNKTNGITPRRWLALANPELSGFITSKIGSGWITDLSELERMTEYADDKEALAEFRRIKQEKKAQLCRYIKKLDGKELSPDFIFDIQIKRLHEYKRQLMNALSILYIYFGIKEGRIKDFYPTAFIFGAKAAASYVTAKAVIKLINAISELIDNDPEVSSLMKVVFISNYNVSYAEYLTPAADISEQISTAGTEASGTGNMKLMLSGAVTLGTYDGANVEIVQNAGEENNYIFGARVEGIERVMDSYDPKKLYESNALIRRCVDALIDGTLSDNSGSLKRIYDSLLCGIGWDRADKYYVLGDLLPYCEAKLRANRDYAQGEGFVKKCFINMANAGPFSSDRTVKQYAEEIWQA